MREFARKYSAAASPHRHAADQRAGRSSLMSDQLAKIRKLVDEISGRNPFYSQKLRGLKFGSLDEFRERAPFTFKQELIDDQRAHPPYGSNLTYPLDQYTRFSQTNGTTGAPLRWLDTPESWDWMVGNWMRVFQSAGVRRGRPHLLRVLLRAVSRLLGRLRRRGPHGMPLYSRRWNAQQRKIARHPGSSGDGPLLHANLCDAVGRGRGGRTDRSGEIEGAPDRRRRGAWRQH